VEVDIVLDATGTHRVWLVDSATGERGDNLFVDPWPIGLYNSRLDDVALRVYC